MELNRRPRTTALTPEDLATVRQQTVDAAAAIVALWQGKFDARIAELKAEHAALGARKSLDEMAKEQSRLAGEIATLTASRDSLLASLADSKAAGAADLKAIQAACGDANRQLEGIKAQAQAAVEQARDEAGRIVSEAREAAAAEQAKADAARRDLAEVQAQVKTAQGNLAAFQERLATEKAAAARALGVA